MNPDLHTTLLELNSHLVAQGWDSPPRLFALVETAQLLAAEPGLAEDLTGSGTWTVIPQDGFPGPDSLEDALGRLAWGDAVGGCALSVERLMLPQDVEAEMPEDPDELDAWVANHPQRREVRILVVVLRDGSHDAALRFRNADTDEEMLFGPELVPGLTEVLLDSLKS